MSVVAVVACDERLLIGHRGDLPWNCPEDLATFRRLTTGHTLLMGRHTFDSIVRRLGRPLSERVSLVLTTRTGEPWPQVEYLSRLESAFSRSGDLYVIGGASVYAQCAAYLETIYLSLIPGEHVGDVFLPDLGSGWRLTGREDFSTFSLLTLHRSTQQCFDWSHLKEL